MKKIVLILFALVICCLSVGATGNEDVKACEELGDESQVCSINEEECECIEYSVNPTNIEHQEGAD